MYGSTFKFCGGTSLSKPYLNTPPPRYKGGYDHCEQTLEIDPKQVFGLAQKYTLNNHFQTNYDKSIPF